MIDLTTRSGKYRIVQDVDSNVIIEQKNPRQEVAFSLADRGMAYALLELCTELEELRAIRGHYRQLIQAVARKWPNETREETALRYIRECETVTSEESNAKEPAEPPLLGHEFKPYGGSC